jgi:predicted ATPase/signal transduction histidine kinase
MTDWMGKYKITNCVHRSESSIIYSAIDISSNEQVALKTNNSAMVDWTSLEKLKNEYHFLSKIKSDFVVKVIDYLQTHDGFYIVMEYCDGIPLAEYIRYHKISIKEFLFIARDIVSGLSDIHNQEIIHKGISPYNILYHPQPRKVTLIDFGASTEFLYEKPFDIDTSADKKILCYVSPEQTGRINRPLDFRSDFYSLGVTFFEMMAGFCPIKEKDATEIIYSHIAKIPSPLTEIRPDVPALLSHMIQKLMAKMPEDRYATAAGILFDLNKCLESWDTKETIAEFDLGLGDVSDRFEIPAKIYGREAEISFLLSAYETALNGGKKLVTIGGHSGVGKTSLVREIQKVILRSNGIFISGKFDQYHKNIPYYALSQALDQFCSIILSENNKSINEWKKRIAKALEQDGKLLIDKVPHLALLSGEIKPIPVLSPVEERSRFKAVVTSFLAEIASPQRPLVLLVDDFHLANVGSMEIVEEFLSSPAINGLLIISCYRDNEVDNDHPLIQSINKMINRQIDVERLSLGGLKRHDAAHMLSDAFHCSEASVREIAEVVFNKTLGNPFYIKEFLKQCHRKELIYFDKACVAWKWDIVSIKAYPAEENVVDFLINNLDQLSYETRDLLSLAACIGQKFGAETLSALSGRALGEIFLDLKAAVSLEIVCPEQHIIEGKSETVFRFLHDRFQQTFYIILPEKKKQQIHFLLARHYEKVGLEPWNYADARFTIADNYAKAFSSPGINDEKERVSVILLEAAHAASLLSAFDTTVRYLELLMGGFNGQEIKKDFTFSVYEEYHSALCNMAKYKEADKIYLLLEKLAGDALQLSDSCCLQAVSLSNRGKYKDAFMLGVGVLSALGVYFPQENLNHAIDLEINHYYEKLPNNNIAGIEALDEALEPQDFAISKLLNRITAAGFFYDPLYSFWAIITNANRMLDNGYTPEGLQLMVDLTLVLITLRNDYHLPYTTGCQAMRLAEKNNYKNELFRIYHVFSLFTSHWFEDVKNSLPYARESLKGNSVAGDFEFACFSFFTTQQAVLETCSNLQELNEEVEAALAFATRTGNIHAYGSFISFQQLYQALMGNTSHDGSFDDKHFLEDSHIMSMSANPMALCYFYTLRALSAIIYLDFDKAFELTETAAPMMLAITGFYPVAIHNFLHSLSICRRLENHNCSNEEKEILNQKLNANQKWLGERATDAPKNFIHLFEIIEAERQALFDSSTELLPLYEKAIEDAVKNNRPYHHALISEIAALRFFKLNAPRSAAGFLKESYFAYLAWGAKGKIAQLKRLYFETLQTAVNESDYWVNSAASNLFGKSHNASLATSIDFNAVIKASQAISGEMQLDAILKKLIQVLLENAGAQKIYYLAQKDNNYYVRAEGEAENEVVNVLMEKPVSANDLPIKILDYVDRTHEVVVLDHAAVSEHYRNDEYITSHGCKSILCMPVINKGKVNGLLYFENNLVQGAFDRQRSEALQTIASQFAISLENAYLYDHLQQLVDEKTVELKKANETLEARVEQRTSQLEMANQELATISYSMAHSIKTPLRALDGFSYMLMDEYNSILDKQGKNYLKRIRNASRDMWQVTDGLMKFLAITREDIHLSQIDISLMAQETMRSIRQLTPERQFEFICPDHLITTADPEMMRILLGNLLDNAWKFTRKSKHLPRIEVGNLLQDGQSVFFIRDNGVGFDMAYYSKLFGIFQRLHSVEDFDGNGVGLAVAQRIIQRHGGRIWADSEVNHGATFYFTFPDHSFSDLVTPDTLSNGL